MNTVVQPCDKPIELVRAALPASKSHAQRALFLAALTERSWRFDNVGDSKDVDVCCNAMRTLGAGIARHGDSLEIEGVGNASGRRITVDCHENGTTVRMLGAIASLLGEWVELDGQPGLRRRPMAPLTTALRAAGVPVEGDRLPLEIDSRGLEWPEVVTADASTSTQVASGLALGITLRSARGMSGTPRRLVVEKPRATAYVELTIHIARAFGAEIESSVEGESLVIDFSGFDPTLNRWRVPGDASAAAFPLVLAAMHGVDVDLEVPEDDPHPDWGIVGDLAQIRAAGSGDVVELDQIARRPDTFPALAAFAATREATVRFRDAAALRAKESDRIAAMARGLDALGARTEELPDGLVVHAPIDRHVRRTRVPAPSDHRIVMALALLGTLCREGLELGPADAVSKSWPRFWDWFADYARVTRGS